MVLCVFWVVQAGLYQGDSFIWIFLVPNNNSSFRFGSVKFPQAMLYSCRYVVFMKRSCTHADMLYSCRYAVLCTVPYPATIYWGYFLVQSKQYSENKDSLEIILLLLPLRIIVLFGFLASIYYLLLAKTTSVFSNCILQLYSVDIWFV